MSRTIDVGGIRKLTIERFPAGSITVGEAGADQVHGELALADPERYEGYLDQVEIDHFHDQLRISLPQHLTNPPRLHLELTAPDGLSYQISTGSADVRISPELDRSRISTGSGSILLTTASDLSANSGSGSITVGVLTGRAAQLGTASGDIRIDHADAPLHARAASGNVRVNRLSADLRASSASGDVSVSATTASADLRTASGWLQVGVAQGLPAWLDLGSASGRIDLKLDADQPPADGDPYVSIRARSASGAISIFRA